MSGHGHHDANADLHEGHDEHHDETTSDDFPADEPHSPGWLPLLGGGLLLAAIFGFVLCGGDDPPEESAKAAAAPAPVPTPAAKPANRPLAPARPGMALPPGHAPLPVPHN